MQTNAALATYLRPLAEFLQHDDVNEISINQPGEIFVEQQGLTERYDMPALDFDHLEHLSHLIATATQQEISAQKPLLSASLPGGERVQIVFPPACEAGSIMMSIRKQTVMNLSLDDYEHSGAFNQVQISKEGNVSKEDSELIKLYQEKSYAEFIRQAVKYKKNIIVSGGTSTGKSTFLNAIIKEIPIEERLITIEDVRELIISHPNSVNLLASRGEQGMAKVTSQDLLETCLRLRPDRILLGELRGNESYAFLRAVNTGHPGSITSLHADTPKGAFEQLVLMVMQAGLGLKRDEILAYIQSVVEIVLQLKRVGKRRVLSDVYYTYA